MLFQDYTRLTFIFLILTVFRCTYSFGQDEHETISIELELNDLDIIDRWDEVSRTTKNAILDGNLAYEEKVNTILLHAQVLKLKSKKQATPLVVLTEY